MKFIIEQKIIEPIRFSVSAFEFRSRILVKAPDLFLSCSLLKKFRLRSRHLYNDESCVCSYFENSLGGRTPRFHCTGVQNVYEFVSIAITIPISLVIILKM